MPRCSKTINFNGGNGFHCAVLLFLSGQMQPFKVEIFKIRRLWSRNAIIIVWNRMNEQAGEGTVAYSDIAHISTTFRGSFDFNAIGRSSYIAIPNLHICNTTRLFTANTDTMTAVAVAVKYADMFCRTIDGVTFRILTGFDGNGVIFGFKFRCK